MSAPGTETMKLGQRELNTNNESRTISPEMLMIFLHTLSVGAIQVEAHLQKHAILKIKYWSMKWKTTFTVALFNGKYQNM